MSTYYYFVCDKDMTKCFAGSTSQGSDLRVCAEDSGAWLLKHSYEDIRLVTEHLEDIHMYEGI